MPSSTQTTPGSKMMLWAGRALSTLVVLFMLVDGLTKLVKVPQVVKAMAENGYPEDLTRGLGIVVLVCTVLYAIPRTSILGAILLTGFLGGATDANVRLENPAYFFSVGMGVLVWAGLFLRDERLRDLIPLRR